MAERDTGNHWFSSPGYRVQILVSISAVWFIAVTGRLVLSPFLPSIISDVGISLTQAGLMLTLLQASHAVLLFPSGRLSDQLSRATVIVPGLTIISVGLLVLASAQSYLVLVSGAIGFGIGFGLLNTPARALVSDHFTKTRGRALGILAAAYSLGGVVASGIAFVTVALWRESLMGIAGILVVLTVVFLFINREEFTIESIDISGFATVGRLLRTKKLRELIIAYALFSIVTQSFVGFFPTFLQEAKGFTPALASTGFGLIFIVGIFSKISSGALSDRYSRRLISVTSLGLAILALSGIVLVETRGALLIFIVLFALGHQAQYPLVDAIFLDAAPQGNLGGDLGAARTILTLIGSIGPAVIGFIAETYDFTIAFGTLVLLLVTIGFLILRQLIDK